MDKLAFINGHIGDLVNRLFVGNNDAYHRFLNVLWNGQTPHGIPRITERSRSIMCGIYKSSLNNNFQ